MYDNIDVSKKRLNAIKKILEKRYKGEEIENVVYVKHDSNKYYVAVSWKSGQLGDEEITYKEIEKYEEDNNDNK
jgi:hypothetical protein